MDDDQLRTLVEQARGGNAEAWDRLHAMCQPRLLADAQRLLGTNWHLLSPRDLTQETWLRARLNLDSYRGEGFLSWLGAIMRNVYRNVQRRQRDRPQSLDLLLTPASEELPAVEGSGSESGVTQPLLDDEMATQIRIAVDSLPAEIREILKLSVMEPRPSFHEIGQRLNLTAKQVRDRYHTGIEALRRRLRGLHDE